MKHIIIPDIYPVACHTNNIGPGSTFVAIKGQKEDGTAYILEALKKGAKKIIISSGTKLDNNILKEIEVNKAELIFEENTRKALAIYSAKALNYPAKKLKILAITGTKGKTTTSFLVEHILKSVGFRTALLSTVKNKILDQEFPASLTTAQPDYLNIFFNICVENNIDYLVMEVAAQAFSLNRVYGLEFDGVIFTNFSQEHAEFYNSLDDYFAAKTRIFDSCKLNVPILINSDDKKIVDYANNNLDKNKFNIFSFGINNKSDISAKIEKSDLSGIQATVFFTARTLRLSPLGFAQGERGENNADFALTESEFIERELKTELVGDFNIYNILAAIGLVVNLEEFELKKISLDQVVNSIKNFTGVPGRLQKIILPNQAIAFIDFAHNPASFEAVLSALRLLSKDLIVVFGAGGDRDKTKRPLMGDIASKIADKVILTSDNPRSEKLEDIIEDIKAGINKENINKVEIELDRKAAIIRAYNISKKNSIIALLGKGPDEYQIVNNKKTYFSEAAILRSL